MTRGRLGRRMLGVIACVAAGFVGMTSASAQEAPTPTVDPADVGGAIGITPTELVYEDVLRGSPVGAAVVIINRTVADRPFEFTFVGEVADWMGVTTFDDRATLLDESEILRGAQAQLRVQVDVPSEVPNGVYTGELQILARPVEGSTVGAGAIVPISVEVTGTQRLEGAVVDVDAGLGEVGVELPIDVRVQNTGNVTIFPVLSVAVIDADGEVVDTITTDGDDPIDPGETRSLLVRWDTTAASIGTYTIEASGLAGDLDLGSAAGTAELVARGTLTRSGGIASMEVVTVPAPGGLAQVRMEVLNTGQIEAIGVFNGQLYRGDDVVSVVDSPPRFLAAGSSAVVDLFFEVAEAGDYRLTGVVNFEGFETDEASVEFRVQDPSSDDGSSLPLVIGIAAGVVVLAGAAAVVLRRRAAR